MQPIQYFIQFDQWSEKIKATKNNPIEKIVAAKKLIELAHIICQRGYQKELKKIFTNGQLSKVPEISEMYKSWDRLLDKNLKSLELAAEYHQTLRGEFSMFDSFIKLYQNEKNKHIKKLLEKKIKVKLETDESVDTFTKGVTCLAEATVSPYELMIEFVECFNEDSYLLKEELPANLN